MVQQIELAHLFGQLLQSDDRFEIMDKIRMGLVCFRLKVRPPIHALNGPQFEHTKWTFREATSWTSNWLEQSTKVDWSFWRPPRWMTSSSFDLRCVLEPATSRTFTTPGMWSESTQTRYCTRWHRPMASAPIAMPVPMVPSVQASEHARVMHALSMGCLLSIGFIERAARRREITFYTHWENITCLQVFILHR